MIDAISIFFFIVIERMFCYARVFCDHFIRYQLSADDFVVLTSIYHLLDDREFKRYALTTPSEELLLCGSFSISSSGFEHAEFVDCSAPLKLPSQLTSPFLPPLTGVLSWSIPVEPANNLVLNVNNRFLVDKQFSLERILKIGR